MGNIDSFESLANFTANKEQSVEEILTFFPELTSDDVKEIEKEVMQLALNDLFKNSIYRLQ